MLADFVQSFEFIAKATEYNYPILIKIVLVLWGCFILTSFVPQLLILGIVPRTIHGLTGVVFAPLLHGNFNHLFFNTIPLLVLSNFLLITGVDYFLNVTVFITLTSGFLIWCFGKPGLHIGASALITGYWGFLITNVVKLGTSTAIILGILSAYYFAGLLFGIFPTKKGISWEGHLFGLIAGVLLSFIYYN